jgi:UDP-N-acetylmuramate--alanine ligase
MENLDLSKIKKVFFVGIGGIGISALAKMAFSRGMEVLGVNDEEGKTVDSLKELGVNIIMSRGILDTLPEADLYVYSDAWLFRGPEILKNAKKTGKPVLSYFEALGQFAKQYKVIAIAGTHGKTTTTAMVAEILVDAGLDPTVIVGSFVKKFNSNFRKGNSEYLVVEADEYNRHFLNFNPFITVVTNIEADHLDCYKDLADIESAFNKLLSQSQNKITDYTKYLDKVPKLAVPGEHNRLDAASAYAIADFIGVSKEITEKSLANFQGTWRRLEKKGMTKEGVIIYDDYSHHPTEVRAGLSGLRELYPKGKKKITVLFQPHLYSRTKALFDEFVTCFDEADKVLLLPIYFAREKPDPEVSSEKLATAIQGHRGEATAFPDFMTAEDAVRFLNLGENDVFVTMGAGEAYKVAEKVFPIY